MKHTRAPWRVAPRHTNRASLSVVAGAKRIAAVWAAWGGRYATAETWAEAEANAALVAAAPELLEAVLELLAFADGRTPLHPGAEVWDTARAAAAKATRGAS